MRHILLLLSIASLAVAVLAFLSNRKPRDQINRALATGGLKTPERVLNYDSDTLGQVVSLLKSKQSEGHRTLLDLYIRPVLIQAV